MEWVIIGILIATIALPLILPKPAVQGLKAARLDEFNFPRSDEGDPVPILFGTIRLRSPNTLWYGNYDAEKITESQRSLGTLFTSKTVNEYYFYYLTLQLGLCIGTGSVSLLKIWAGKRVVWEGVQSTVGDLDIDAPTDEGWNPFGGGVGFYNGAFTQIQDAALFNFLGADVPNYGGIVHIVMKGHDGYPRFNFGKNPTIPALNFELQNLTDLLSTGRGTIGSDANPIEIIYDLLTSTWGKLGIDPTSLDTASFEAAAETLFDEELGLSLVVTSPNSGKDVIAEILRHIDGLMYQDPATGKIVIKLVRADYNPDTLLELNTSNVREMRNFAKSTWEGTVNEVRVNFPNRHRNYEDGVVIAQDMANINFQDGKIKSVTYSMPFATEPIVASRIAARSLSILSVPLFRVELEATRVAATLRPGDVFKLSWAPYGLESMLMRVLNINYGELTSGTVRLSAVQDQFAVARTLFANPAVTLWEENLHLPVPVPTREYFDAPAFFLLKRDIDAITLDDIRFGSLYGVTDKPAPDSVAFDTYCEFPGGGVRGLILKSVRYAPAPTLDAGMLATTGADDGYIASITINVSDIGEATRLNSFLKTALAITDPATTLRHGENLFKIDDEFFCCRGFTDDFAGSGTFVLVDVYRALFDTKPIAHADGAQIYFIPDLDGLSDARFILNQVSIGTPINLWTLDNTHKGQLPLVDALQDSITAAPTRIFYPLPPDYTLVEGQRTGGTFSRSGDPNINVTWRHRTRSTQVVFMTDASETPETNTLYKVRWRFNAGSWTEVTAIAGDNYTIVDGALTTGTLEVEVISYFATGTLIGTNYPAYPRESWTADYSTLTVTA